MTTMFPNKSFRPGSKVIGIIAVLTSILLFSSSIASCTSSTSEKPQGVQPASSTSTQQGVPVKVSDVKETQMASSLAYTGDVKPTATVSLSTKAMGRIEELKVDVGSTVHAGEVIGHLDQATIQAQLSQAEAALAAAKAKQAQLEAGPRSETVAQAEANLQAAQAKLAQMKAGPTKEQLEEAETAVRVAKDQLYAVQAQADAYIASKAVNFGQSVYTKDMKEANSGAAEEQVKLAQAKLAELKAGPTQEQLDQAQAAVDAAQAQLDLAKNPFTQNDFAAAGAGVKQAQASVDLVKTQLADTNIVSPVDGVVSDKYLSVGALASPQTPILNIISSDLEVALSVEEARAGQIQVGQPVSLTVSAYPDTSFAGTVSSVAPAIDPRTRTFTVKVKVKDNEGKLKAGMFAKVRINLDEKQAALAVPEQAVVKSGADSIVFVVNGGKALMRKVELGASDGQNVEVKSGLTAGEKVIISNTSLKDGDPVVVEGR